MRDRLDKIKKSYCGEECLNHGACGDIRFLLGEINRLNNLVLHCAEHHDWQAWNNSLNKKQDRIEELEEEKRKFAPYYEFPDKEYENLKIKCEEYREGRNKALEEWNKQVKELHEKLANEIKFRSEDISMYTGKLLKLESRQKQLLEMLYKSVELISGLSDAEWYDHEDEESNFIKEVEDLKELEES